MFDWVALENYSNLHYYIQIVIAAYIVLTLLLQDHYDPKTFSVLNMFGALYLLFSIFYIGQRPISGKYFGDTYNYAQTYYSFQRGEEVIITKDLFFSYFMKFCSNYMSVHSFYTLLYFLYVTPYVIFAKKWFKQYWFIAVFLVINSFLFFGSATNGLRNGLATSIFILGLAFYDKKKWMYLCFLLAYFMHASMFITIFAFLVAIKSKVPKYNIIIWVSSIVLSLAGGGIWLNLFSSIGFDDRAEEYLLNSDELLVQFSSTGFRWDFLLYSATAIAIGWYYIYVKKINDRFYLHLFNTYCLANAFWVLVITAAFSNRFAYLSWFLIPIIIGYPLFKYEIWKKQQFVYSSLMVFYLVFTLYMNLI